MKKTPKKLFGNKAERKERRRSRLETKFEAWKVNYIY